MVDTRTATRTVLMISASADQPERAASPTELIDTVIRPGVLRFGGTIDGAYHGLIVASFPEAEAALDAATELEETAGWAVPGVEIETAVVADRQGALPSAEAVSAGERALKAAGAAIPLGGAGVGAIVLWKPEVGLDEATSPAPEPAPVTEGGSHVHGHEHEPSEPVAEVEVIDPDADVDGVLVFADDPDQIDLAVEALSRFDEAGLDVPEGLQIYFHGEDAPECQGHTNRAFASHGGEVERIDMCTPHDFTLRHEIAHTWAHEHLEDGSIDAFLEMRGLSDWQGNAEWAANGSEQAAHIIAWGLADRPFPMGEIPDATDFGDLGDAFATLTGNRPLHDRTRVAVSEADDDFSALDLVEDAAPEAPVQAPRPTADDPIEPVVATSAAEPYEPPTTGGALAVDDGWEADVVDDDDDDDDDVPVVL